MPMPMAVPVLLSVFGAWFVAIPVPVSWAVVVLTLIGPAVRAARVRRRVAAVALVLVAAVRPGLGRGRRPLRRPLSVQVRFAFSGRPRVWTPVAVPWMISGR
ncbi:hypothetical protein [Sphaerisporangium melleum]|nr:hypothetical protein [Sphaerisporangium melleum]